MYKDFDTIAQYYDLMYVNSDNYKQEVEKIVDIFKIYNKSGCNKLLDIACGTGGHTEFLKNHFNVTGIDLSSTMIEIARNKFPDISFIEADMFDFTLPTQFDIIVNLYGSIGYAKSYEHFLKGLKCVEKHLKKGGIFILTPWSTTETFKTGLFTNSKIEGGIQFSRMEAINLLENGKINIDMHHLIGKNNQINYYHNEMYLSLFSEDQYRSGIEKAGLTILKRLDETEFCMGAFICIKN